MALMVLDPAMERQLKAEREASGLDRYDETWEGVYMMAPLANTEHQRLQSRLAAALQIAIGWDAPVNNSSKARKGGRGAAPAVK